MSQPIVLVTGGTGYLGSHIIQQLLAQDQYIVRATARKSDRLQNIFPDADPSKLQIVEVASLDADHSDAVKGVWALVHSASPLSAGHTPKEIFEGAYHGTVNVVDAAIKANVKKIIITGSFVNLVDAEFKAAYASAPITHKSWGPATLENFDAGKATPGSAYSASKTIAERWVWDVAHQHPEVDVTVLHPPVIFGPFIPRALFSKDSKHGRPLGTVDYIRPLLDNKYPAYPLGHMVDVRDVAKAHALALSTPPTKDGQDKRFLIIGHIFTWREVAEVLRRQRPALASRLPPVELDADVVKQTDAPFETSLSEEVLGFKREMYTDWQKTVVESVDQIVEWEQKTSN